MFQGTVSYVVISVNLLHVLPAHILVSYGHPRELGVLLFGDFFVSAMFPDDGSREGLQYVVFRHGWSPQKLLSRSVMKAYLEIFSEEEFENGFLFFFLLLEAQEPVWTLWRRDKLHGPSGKGTPVPWSSVP
jgi:hypothetical protein